MMIIGKGVKPNGGQPRVFGKTDENLFPMKLHLETGAYEGRGIDYLRTQNALATLLQMAGIEHESFVEADPIPSLLS